MSNANHNPERPLDLERLVFFSDAVIAIAITLLVIDLSVPDELTTDAELRSALAALGPNFFSFVLSFAVIGLWWSSHHRLVRVMEHSHAAFVVLNFVLLGSIVFLPFASGILGHHGDLTTAVLLYAATNLTAAGTIVAMRILADRLGLLRTDIDLANYRRRTVWAAATGVVFLASIPIALISPSVATAIWWLVLTLAPLRAWHEHRLAHARSRP